MLRGSARREGSAALLRRVEFHYTPKHASWLNMAEIEIGILERQCLRRLAERTRSPPKLRRGSGGETPIDVASSGRLRVGMQIESWAALCFVINVSQY